MRAVDDSSELPVASRTPFALLGTVEGQIATIEFLAVRALNDLIDIVAFHLYETEASERPDARSVTIVAD